LVCLSTLVSTGAALLAPATLYRKMYCVELAASVLPVGRTSELWPAVRTASVVPSGLSFDRTAIPATKFGYAGRPGLNGCCTESSIGVGETYCPGAIRAVFT